MTDLPQPSGDTSDIEQHFSRIYAITGTRTQLELADVLGVKQSAVSDAKKRGKIPDTWLVTLLRIYGVNPAWILMASEHKFLEPANILSDPQPVLLQKQPYEAKILDHVLGCLPTSMIISELRRRRGGA